MTFSTILQESEVILTEGAIAERMRRRDDIELHPTLFNTPLVYNEYGRSSMREIYGQYRQIGLEAKVPVLLCAPTWRVDQSRVIASGLPVSMNMDAVRFMKENQANWQAKESPIFVGGLVGPKNDCYQPQEALLPETAEEYHRWQIRELAEAGVDVIIAQTFPAISEAIGVARCCKQIGIPLLVSFVINRHGLVLDGTPIAEAVDRVDLATNGAPLGYMVNCVYPTFLLAEHQPPELFRRLMGIQANASSLDHQELDGSVELKQSDPKEWGMHMLELNREYGVKILGGCCGTDDRYLRYIANNLRPPASSYKY